MKMKRRVPIGPGSGRGGAAWPLFSSRREEVLKEGRGKERGREGGREGGRLSTATAECGRTEYVSQI